VAGSEHLYGRLAGYCRKKEGDHCFDAYGFGAAASFGIHANAPAADAEVTLANERPASFRRVMMRSANCERGCASEPLWRFYLVLVVVAVWSMWPVPDRHALSASRCAFQAYDAV